MNLLDWFVSYKVPSGDVKIAIENGQLFRGFSH